MLKRTSDNLVASAIAVPLIVAIVAGAFLFAGPAGAADDPRLVQAQEQVRAYCTDLVDDATTTRQRNTRADLCTMWTRQLADLQPSPTTTTPPTTTPPTTTPPPTPTPSPTPTTPPPAQWPGAANTGVPAGTTLTAYTGPCSVTILSTSIVGKAINCSVLQIHAAGVTITNSRVNGVVLVPSGGTGSLVMTDSEIFSPAGQTGIDGSRYTVIRGDISGGNRQGNCDRSCTVRDSWLHGTRIYPASQHASGFRLGQYTTVEHNTITCDAAQTPEGGGCSAPITGYPDTAPLHHNTVAGNNIAASPNSAFCAYGGATSGKPYSNDSTNATYIVFRDNVFGRGTSGRCAIYGVISDFASGRTGNVWSNNRFDNGTLITL